MKNYRWRYPHIQEVKKSLVEIKEVSGISADNTIRRYCQILLEKRDKILERALDNSDNVNY
jgi:hypothetical protein